MAGGSYRNFRLRGIHDNLQSQKQVRDLVKDALKLDEYTEITVHSLAKNPLEPSSRIATLTFSNDLPMLPEGSRNEWAFSIPDTEEDEAEKWGPQKLIFDTHFRGFTPLHRAEDTECLNDLVAISGLAGHAFGSFKARGSDFMWLRDDLPVQLRRTRILIYGYDTNVVASCSFQNLTDLGNTFRNSIKRLQLGSSAGYQLRPTIFLGHSLGGLVIKEAMIMMKGSGKEEEEEFLDKVVAFMFFGVPHQGMATEHLVPMVGDQPNRGLIESLGRHSAILQRYEAEFPAALRSKGPPEILSFYETEMSPTAKFNERKQIWESDGTRLAVLVDRSSATNGSSSQSAIARNHSEMVKFTSQMDEMYDIVLASLLPLLHKDSILSSLSANHTECLKSLTFKERHLRQHEIHDAERTCGWLFDDPHYRHWISQPRGLLWIKGKPGAGKSVLMKFAFEKMRERSSDLGELVASFYVHGRGVDLQKSPVGIFRALLQELIPHFNDTLSQIAARFEEREKLLGSYQQGRWEWTEKELEQFLRQVLTDKSKKRRVVIFIDALDECEKDAPVRLLTFLKRFGEKIEQHNSWVKICFSSRHYPILGQAEVPTILVEEKNRDDIRQVMEEKLKDIESEEERQQIVHAILSKDDGVFQWAVLVAAKAVDKHRRGYNVRAIRREIETLPAELDSLYAGLLDEVNKDENDKVETLKLFRWVLFACRPLSVRELREALAIDPHVSCATILELRENDNCPKPAERFERRVIDMSKGLIEFKTRDVWESLGPDDEGANREAEFIHQSVPDYLLEYFLKPTETFDLAQQSSAGRGHFDLSRSCLRYLTMREILGASKLPRVTISVEYPLVPYAIRYFFDHVRAVEAEKVHQQDLLLLLRWDDETRKSMAELWRTFDPQNSYTPVDWPFQNGNILHVLAALGSLSAFKALVCQNDVEVDCKDSSKNTPLIIAIREGHHDVALELLDRYAKWSYRHGRAIGNKDRGLLDAESLPPSAKTHFVDVNAENDDYDTPMAGAVYGGATEVICSLIEAGAFLGEPGPAASPVLYAIRTKNKDLLNKLIEHEAKLDGAVYYAAARTSGSGDDETEELIRILLHAGANTHSPRELVYYASNEFYDEDDEEPEELKSGSAFQIAVHKEQLAILELILTHHSETEDLNDALMVAVERNNVIMAGMILNHGVQIQSAIQDVVRDRSLSVAVEKGNMPMVELFFDCGNSSGPNIHDALMVAVSESNLLLAELLLNRGATMNSSETKLPDVLMAAVGGSNVRMTQLLLNHEAMISSSGPTELHDALVVAVGKSDKNMAKLLLDHGAKMEQTELHDALVVAVGKSDKNMAKLLLDHGAKMEQTELHDALVVAVGEGRQYMAELLLDHGANMEPTELHDALVGCVRKHYSAMAKLLMDLGAESNISGPKELQDAFVDAVRTSRLYTAELIMDHGVDALRSAAEINRGHIISDLLGLQMFSSDQKELQNALMIAVKNGHLFVAELLLDHGVEINVADQEGSTQLLVAESRCDVSKTEFLLSRGANSNEDGLRGIPLYQAVKRCDLKTTEFLLSRGASPNLEQFSPLALAVKVRNPSLVQVLLAHGASLDRKDTNGRTAFGEAILRRDKFMIKLFVQLVVTMNYGDSLTWPHEYSTEDKITDALASNGLEDYTGVLVGIVNKAILSGNEELIEFMLKFAGVGADSTTGKIDWHPGNGAEPKMMELQSKLSEAIEVNGKNIAPIIVAVAFKRLSMVKMLLEMGRISEESLVQASFLVTSLQLGESFDHLLAKRPDPRCLSARISQVWPFLGYGSTFSTFFCRFGCGTLSSIAQWYPSLDSTLDGASLPSNLQGNRSSSDCRTLPSISQWYPSFDSAMKPASE